MAAAGKPLVVGLTGSIGMGKSTVAAMFAALGVPVFDADAEVHSLQARGGALVPAIEAAFPGVTRDGAVDRARLGALVLGDRPALSRLEAIVHPAVAAERRRFLQSHIAQPLVVMDIPLLFEKTGRAQVDAVVVVSAPPEVQKARVLARPGMSEDKFQHILGLQVPDRQKQEMADFVIDTGGSLEDTRRQVAQLVDKLTGKGPGGPLPA